MLRMNGYDTGLGSGLVFICAFLQQVRQSGLAKLGNDLLSQFPFITLQVYHELLPNSFKGPTRVLVGKVDSGRQEGLNVFG